MIQHLEVKGFTVFGDNNFDFSKGINVFIGQNATGKTHLLKLMASTLLGQNDFLKSPSQAKDKLESLIAEALLGYFKPMQLGRLVKRQPGRTSASVLLKVRNKNFSYSFASNSKTNVKTETEALQKEIKFLYIPPREMFSLYEGFLGLVRTREVPFDYGYIKFAEALNTGILKGPRGDKTNELIAPLEKALNIKVLKEDGRFYIRDESGKMEAHLVAEGIRKLASIMYVVLNGELNKNSVLFWDEPESNLNPTLISVVADFIQILARNGVQVFISTHDYLLTHLLSLKAEHREITHAPDMKFFCLNKDSKGIIDIQAGSTLLEIENNPILNEYEAFYDLQQEYISQKLNLITTKQ
jgi:predicted ATPase